jgi:hypothetical protein
MEERAMGQVLHGCAATTKAIRRAIQHSQARLRQLARRYGINPKTARKWRARSSVVDLRTGPKEPRSTVLSTDEEAVVVAFRRCLQRHGISRLPRGESDKPTRKTFKAYPIDYLHIGIAKVQTAEGKLYLYVAADQPNRSRRLPRGSDRSRPLQVVVSVNGQITKTNHRWIFSIRVLGHPLAVARSTKSMRDGVWIRPGKPTISLRWYVSEQR